MKRLTLLVCLAFSACQTPGPMPQQALSAHTQQAKVRNAQQSPLYYWANCRRSPYVSDGANALKPRHLHTANGMRFATYAHYQDGNKRTIATDCTVYRGIVSTHRFRLTAATPFIAAMTVGAKKRAANAWLATHADKRSTTLIRLGDTTRHVFRGAQTLPCHTLERFSADTEDGMVSALVCQGARDASEILLTSQGRLEIIGVSSRTATVFVRAGRTIEQLDWRDGKWHKSRLTTLPKAAPKRER